MSEKQYYVYIMMNRWNTTSYICKSSKLLDRVGQHKEKVIKGFTEKYNLNKLVYYESFDNVQNAISREKQLKKWSRKKKVELIKRVNSEFKDLTNDLV